MNIIAVDDERAALWLIEQVLRDVAKDAQVACFASAEQALAHAREAQVDIAFLDIEMDGMNGLALAKRLKDIQGRMNIIFVTGYSAYSVSAFDLRASGYVLKPIDPQRVAEELQNLRYPIQMADVGLRIQCFGNFEVFADGRPVPFGRPKAKELLAYLVDRLGASISKKELASILWENQPYTRSIQVHIHVLLGELTQVLAAHGAADAIIRGRGYYAVDTGKLRCDYFDYCRGDAAAVNSYRGEYMTNYSWAEFTAGTLAT